MDIIPEHNTKSFRIFGVSPLLDATFILETIDFDEEYDENINTLLKEKLISINNSKTGVNHNLPFVKINDAIEITQGKLKLALKDYLENLKNI